MSSGNWRNICKMFGQALNCTFPYTFLYFNSWKPYLLYDGGPYKCRLSGEASPDSPLERAPSETSLNFRNNHTGLSGSLSETPNTWREVNLSQLDRFKLQLLCGFSLTEISSAPWDNAAANQTLTKQTQSNSLCTSVVTFYLYNRLRHLSEMSGNFTVGIELKGEIPYLSHMG